MQKHSMLISALMVVACNCVLRVHSDGGSPATNRTVVSSSAATNATTNSRLFDAIRRTYVECAAQSDLFKCLKIRALKLVERSMRAKEFVLLPGVDVVQVKNGARQARILHHANQLSEEQLQSLEDTSINDLIYEAAFHFLETHVININLPRLVEEARGRRKKNRFAGPFLAALAVKGVIMSMTYKSIAVVAGTALIVGKMALVLAAILGLKKLISHDKEKTTVEIVKHPTHSTSHTHSSSYEEEGHYRRSIPSDEEMMILDNLNRDSYLN